MAVILHNVTVECDYCKKQEAATVRLPGSQAVVIGSFVSVEHPLGWVCGLRTQYCSEQCATAAVEARNAEIEARIRTALLTDDKTH